MIKRICENCTCEDLPYDDNCCCCKHWYNADSNVKKDNFMPKEVLVRVDERKKIIDFIENNKIFYVDFSDDKTNHYSNKAIERYKERLINMIKKIKLMED